MKRLAVNLILFAALLLPAGENDYLKPIGRSREAKAQRRQGGESLPPLPLPATPLRRSEKKRPPSPTVLIGTVIWGGYLDYRYPDGQVQRLFDWNMAPADCQQLLRKFKETTKLEYTVKTVDLASFSGNPAEIPILHFSGGRTIRFTGAERAKLRSYLLNGGTIWFDSIVGSPYFYEGALAETAKILPDSPVRTIAPDHALFRIVSGTTRLKADHGEEIMPEIQGAYVGSRLAVVLSQRGMGAGWDNIVPDEVKNARYYDPGSSQRLGVNLAAYAIGWFESGQCNASGTESGAGQIVSADRIDFVQLKTRGLWNPDPGAEAKFMRYLSGTLHVDAGTAPVYADPEKDDLSAYPFLYLTGIGPFDLTEKGTTALREYLNAGGYLVISNALGMNDFDRSVQMLVSRLYPGRRLEKLREDHPLFRKGPFRFSASGLSEAGRVKFPGQRIPVVFGLHDGTQRCMILYSPAGMAGGWQNVSRPGSVCYDPETSLRLGGTIIAYVSTH